MINNNIKSSERGSAILWILIAVGLFAALNYAFTNSTRTSTSLLTDTQAESYANQIIAYGNEVKSAIKRMQLRGCSDTEISFENAVVSGYSNPNSPSNKSCHVFDIAGGGVQYKNLDTSWLDKDASTNTFYGENIFMIACPLGVGTDLNDTTGSSCNTNTNTLAHGDLVLITPYIKKEICEAINKKLIGATIIPTDAINSFYNTAQHDGDFNIVTAQSIIFAESAYNGKKSICYQDGVGSTVLLVDNYAYMNVLIAR